jgi:F0F1-type ATP synthase membrane subunit b/b'
MFLSLDGTSLVQLINLGIFYLILNAVFLRPVGAAIRKRREYITGVRADYDRYRHQVDNLTREANEKRAAARREAGEFVHEARARAENEAHAIVARYGEDASKLTLEADATVEKESAAAREREPKLVSDLARQLLERVVGAPA